MRMILISLLALIPFTAAASDFSEAELLEAVQTYAPTRYEKLMELRESDPDAYEDALEKVAEKLIQQKMEKAEYKEHIAEMKARFQELAAEHAAASPRKQEDVRLEMEALAQEFFEMQMAAKRMRLEAIQAKVTRMEEQLERKESRRDEIIDRYVEAALQAEEE